MKPLVFLTYRSFVNGLRRAMTSPKRLLSLLGVTFYYFYFFVWRSFQMPTSAKVPPQMAGRLAFPAMDIVDAVAFAVFAGLSLMMMLGIFAYRGGFKPADVDVLFPTPVSPKAVLVFRIVREYLGTLILPFFFLLVFFRPATFGWQAMFRNMPHPESSGTVFKAMSVAWMLMAMVWVAISYAAGLFVNRSDRRSDLNKRVMTWSLVAIVGGVGIYAAMAIRNIDDAHGLVTLAQSPVLRTAFFTATAATAITLSPLQGTWTPALLGFGAMIGCIALALRLALTQVGWLYDQAAARGFAQQDARALQAKGDMFAMAAQRASTGKARRHKRSWVHKLRIQGPLALIWKEYFLMKRAMQSLLLALLLPALFMGVMPLLMASGEKGKAGPIIFVFMQCFAVLMITMNLATTGFMEVLRRVDVQKPLPFSPAAVAFAEIATKAAWAAIANGVAIVVVMAFRPDWWSYVLASAIFGPTLSLLISATAFMAAMLFPDADDSSQRMFHRLILMLAIVILAAPAFGAGLVLAAVGVAPPLAAAAGGIVNVALALGLAHVSGGQYSSYNPSE